MIRPSRYDRDDEDFMKNLANVIAAMISFVLGIAGVAWFYHTFLQWVK